MEQQKQEKKNRNRHGWQLFFTAAVSALAGVLLACLILPVVLTGYLKDLVPTTDSQTDPTTSLEIRYDNPVPTIASACSGSVVLITTSKAGTSTTRGETILTGSGVILSEDGYIGTNQHLLQGAERITVTFTNGDKLSASIVGTDSKNDLAVLKVRASGLTPVKFGDSDQLVVGDLVVAIGNPFGSSLTNSVTVGYISALNRPVKIDGTVYSLMQMDAAINPGNSGGGLFNSNGELVGINTMKSRVSGTDTQGNEIFADGIAFAIPSNTAQKSFNSIRENGSVQQPSLGLELEDLALEGEEAGTAVAVKTVTQNGPAQTAGIQVGDRILSYDGTTCTKSEELTAVVQQKSVGDTMVLRILRGEEQLDIAVVVGDANTFAQ